MKTRKNNALIMKTAFGVLVLALCVLASPRQAQAQLPAPPPVNLNYSFDVPVLKVVPNPCTTGFVLVSGNMNVKVTTTESSSGFGFTLGLNATGKGQDALKDGLLILDGTQKSNYLYSSSLNGDASFQKKPAYFSLETPMTDGLFREFNDNSDAIVMETNLALTFTNGVPGAPVIKDFNVRCSK
jgi:hypothetical protein